MSLDTIIGEYYLLDKQIYKCNECNYLFDTSTYHLYEVLRTEKGVLVFFEDHMERMHEGLNRLGYEGLYRTSHFKNELLVFLKANASQIGNIKILCAIRENELNFAAYYIPHIYPDEKIYYEGINLMTFSIERADPQIKQIHVSNLVKQNIERIIMENTADRP
jgi:branched-chain amino acid aminotransferase